MEREKGKENGEYGSANLLRPRDLDLDRSSSKLVRQSFGQIWGHAFYTFRLSFFALNTGM